MSCMRTTSVSSVADLVVGVLFCVFVLIMCLLYFIVFVADIVVGALRSTSHQGRRVVLLRDIAKHFEEDKQPLAEIRYAPRLE